MTRDFAGARWWKFDFHVLGDEPIQYMAVYRSADCLQNISVREQVCRINEGGRAPFVMRNKRLLLEHQVASSELRVSGSAR